MIETNILNNAITEISTRVEADIPSPENQVVYSTDVMCNIMSQYREIIDKSTLFVTMGVPEDARQGLNEIHIAQGLVIGIVKNFDYRQGKICFHIKPINNIIKSYQEAEIQLFARMILEVDYGKLSNGTIIVKNDNLIVRNYIALDKIDHLYDANASVKQLRERTE